MSIFGKKAIQVEIKSSGDAFHSLFKHKPHDVSKLSDHVHGCDLHEGEFGTVGSVISWKYVHDGKVRFGKEIVKDINEEKRSITFDVIEGDLLEQYKTILITFHVDREGENDLVTWTCEYEKLNEGVPDPDTFVEYLKNVTKGIESGHLKE